MMGQRGFPGDGAVARTSSDCFSVLCMAERSRWKYSFCALPRSLATCCSSSAKQKGGGVNGRCEGKAVVHLEVAILLMAQADGCGGDGVSPHLDDPPKHLIRL